jgi:hypothetical protein
MNITYLLGAGASKNTLPLIDKIGESILHLKDSLKSEFSFNNETIRLQGKEYLLQTLFNEFTSDLTWLSEECANHQSIDTFAKKLYITQEWDLLKKLKASLSLFFMILQSKTKVDLRYDSFFASILTQHHLIFPSNLRILSWNYDTQIEMAYSGYSKDFRNDACQSSLNIAIKNCKSMGSDDGFSITKLNGTAAIFRNEQNQSFQVIQKNNSQFSQTFLIEILKNYAVLTHIPETKSKTESSLSFAWEGQNDPHSIINTAIANTRSTEILVVIGYSFPFFNREVDRKIIRAMVALKKVYFQAPDANALKERFLAIRDDIKDNNLLERYDVNQFVFPNEF